MGTEVPEEKLMAALNVTAWFTNEGFNADVRLTEVFPELTTWASAVAPEALPVKFASPLV